MDQIENVLKHYISWEYETILKLNCNSGVDIKGEPKFYLNGTCYTDPWLRPQNDGAGLRSIVLIKYANYLISKGNADFVKNNMYKEDYSQPGLKSDLQYITNVWNKDAGDPWEDMVGQVLFQKLVNRRALLDGAKLAQTIGDPFAAQYYNKVAGQIQQDIMSNHWDQANGLLKEVPIKRDLDSATHLGTIYGDAEDGFLAADTDYVQSSVAVLIDNYLDFFSINGKDTEKKIPGVLVGRYLKDAYNGFTPGQPSGANPWTLCSAGLAEIFYRAAYYHSTSGKVQINSANQKFWSNVKTLSDYADILDDSVSFNVGSVFTKQDNPVVFSKIMKALIATGDGILLRIRYHIQDHDFHMTEQINKDSGDPQGAENLTWSYGTVIGAMDYRKKAAGAVANLISMN
jgi:glucoamylase